jgi:enoyl-CoA hydratase/carnithine racemase
MSSFVSTLDRDGIRTITLANPGRMNAVPPDGWSMLAEAFDGFEVSDQRVLIVTGADGEFCAGADMNRTSESVPSAADNAERMRSTVNRAAIALHRITKPTIAAVDGVAVGAGMNLAIGCDIVVATPRARFSEVFVKRGLTLDMGGTWLLPRLVGLAKARELALTGRVIGAAEALAIGLITEVVDVDGHLARVGEIADQLASGAPLAQSFIKRALDRSSSMTFEQALAFEEHAQAVLLASDDVVEGANSFIEKRKPRFTGR